MTRHRDVLDSAVLAEHYPIFREAERVIADPIVRNRGTIGGSLCQADPASDLSAVGSALKGTAVVVGPGGLAPRRAARVPRGPVRDRRAVRRDPHRDPLPDPARRGVGVREGRAPRRRLGRRHLRASTSSSAAAWSPTAASGSPPSAPTTTARPRARPALVGKEPTEENLARGRGSDRRRRCSPTADQRGPGRLQEAPRPRTHPARAASRRPSQPGSLSMQVNVTDQRGRDLARGRAAHAARALHPRRPAHARHPLGLRHLQLRRLHRLGRRRAGEELHDARRAGRRQGGHHGRGPRQGRRARPGADRASWSATASSAATAPPG